MARTLLAILGSLICTVILLAGQVTTASSEPTSSTDPSPSASSESKTGYRGSTKGRQYVVYGNHPVAADPADAPTKSDTEAEDEHRGASQQDHASDESGNPPGDPLKIYIGDPATGNVDREVDVVPENLCHESPDSNEVDSNCLRIADQGCADDASVLSYELGDGTSRARCVQNDEIQQAVNELQDQGQESLPTAAYTAFTDLDLGAAEVKFEPDLLGFGYKGRHTNMYADVETQTVTQELLGETVELRATPQEFHWGYGDGTSRTTYEPGEPLPDYDGSGEKIIKTDFATETSHVYEETGIYPVTVETVYTGQFRVGGGEWRDIPGTVAVPSSPGEADIWTQNSRWVSGACESRQQWGCNGPIQFDPATDRPPKIYQDQYDENGRWIGPVE